MMENDKGISSTIMVMENDKGMSSTIMPEKMSFSRAFTMPGATEGNTSPISSVLRLLALDDVAQAAEITSVSKLGRESCTQAECSALAMLAPLDEWMSQPLELQGLSILRKSLLVSSPGLVSSKETEMEGTSVNEFLGIVY